MKGSELLGQIMGLFILIGISFVAGGVVLFVIDVGDTTDWGSSYALTLSPVHQPIKYEVMILSYLETTHKTSTGTKLAAKNIIIKAIERNKVENIDFGGDGTISSLSDITEDTFDAWFGIKSYLFLLQINDEVHRLAGSSTSFRGVEDKKVAIKKLAIPVKAGLNQGTMILYVK